jgi:hypothetical protein
MDVLRKWVASTLTNIHEDIGSTAVGKEEKENEKSANENALDRIG